MAQALLESEGIDAEIPDENLAGLAWHLGSAVGCIRLVVNPADAEAARLVLAETALPAADEENGERCPACGSARVGPPAWKRRYKGLGLLFVPFIPILLLVYAVLALTTGDRECAGCGHRWESTPAE